MGQQTHADSSSDELVSCKVVANRRGQIVRLEYSDGKLREFNYGDGDKLVSVRDSNGSLYVLDSADKWKVLDRHSQLTEQVLNGAFSIDKEGTISFVDAITGSTTSETIVGTKTTTTAKGFKIIEYADRDLSLFDAADRTLLHLHGGGKIVETADGFSVRSYDGAVLQLNSKGRILQIVYPDLTKRQFIYERDGIEGVPEIASYIDRDGHDWRKFPNHVWRQYNHAGATGKTRTGTVALTIDAEFFRFDSKTKLSITEQTDGSAYAAYENGSSLTIDSDGLASQYVSSKGRVFRLRQGKAYYTVSGGTDRQSLLAADSGRSVLAADSLSAIAADLLESRTYWHHNYEADVNDVLRLALNAALANGIVDPDCLVAQSKIVFSLRGDSNGDFLNKLTRLGARRAKPARKSASS